MMIRYEFRKADAVTVGELIELSKKWCEEGCSHGIVPNTAEDIGEPLCVAVEGDRIVGYIFGHFYTPEKKTSYIEVGSACFMVDELYVLPEYRERGIGKELFCRLEAEVRSSCSYVTLSTSTKDYQRILRFYVEGMGMDFHSAFLIKPTTKGN